MVKKLTKPGTCFPLLRKTMCVCPQKVSESADGNCQKAVAVCPTAKEVKVVSIFITTAFLGIERGTSIRPLWRTLLFHPLTSELYISYYYI